MEKTLAYIRLMRPANILTSLADILLGFAASGAAATIITQNEFFYLSPELKNLYLLLGSSACLYGGGVVLNDLFDFEIDKVERPERPLPSGKAQPLLVLLQGFVLSFGGVALAMFVSLLSGLIALLIVTLSLLYNRYLKNIALWGPINMAGCRVANLFLGLTVLPNVKTDSLLLLVIPLLYIISVTNLSRGEVNGSQKRNIETSLLLIILLLIYILHLSLIDRFSFISSAPYLVLFILFSIPGILKALKNPDQPMLIRKAVKKSILGLILLDAAIAAGFTDMTFGLIMVLLLPLSIFLARTFAVS